MTADWVLSAPGVRLMDEILRKGEADEWKFGDRGGGTGGKTSSATDLRLDLPCSLHHSEMPQREGKRAVARRLRERVDALAAEREELVELGLR